MSFETGQMWCLTDLHRILPPSGTRPFALSVVGPAGKGQCICEDAPRSLENASSTPSDSSSEGRRAQAGSVTIKGPCS